LGKTGYLQTAVKTNVVVFMFTTTQTSKLIYTALFKKCLACKKG